MPSGIVFQWADEIQTITDQFKVYLYFGSVSRGTGGVGKYNIIEDVCLTRKHPLFKEANPGRNIVLTSIETFVKRNGQGAHDKNYAHAATGDSDHSGDEGKTDDMLAMIPEDERDEEVVVAAGDPPSSQASRSPRKKRRIAYKPNPTWRGNLRRRFSMVVLDEAQKVKSRASQAFTAVRELHAQFYILLTATPMVSGVHDLKSSFDLMLMTSMNQHWNDLTTEEKDRNLFLCSGDRAELMAKPPDVLFAPEAHDKWIWADPFLKKAKSSIIPALAPVLATCFTKRTLSSMIGSTAIGASVPPAIMNRVKCRFSPAELNRYTESFLRILQQNQGPSGDEVLDQHDIQLDFKTLRHAHLLGTWLGAYEIEAVFTAGRGKQYQQHLNGHGHLGRIFAGLYCKNLRLQYLDELDVATSESEKARLRELIASIPKPDVKEYLNVIPRERALTILLNGSPVMREMLRHILTQVYILG